MTYSGHVIIISHVTEKRNKDHAHKPHTQITSLIMAPKESGTVKQKKPKEDSKKPKVGKVHVKPKDSDDNAPKEEHNVEDSDRKKKRRKSNGDAEGAADSDEKESKKNKPDASTDEKEQKPNKKPSKLAALFNKGKSNDSTETESIIPVHPGN